MTAVLKSRWLSLILAVAVTLSLVGCSFAVPDDGQESGTPKEEVADEADLSESESDMTETEPIEKGQPLLSRHIYLCDDVYRTDSTPTHGEASVYSEAELTDYVVEDCKILLCDDGCDPTDVLNRAFSGYAHAWRIDRYEEHTTGDGWRYDTRRYINEVPEQIRRQMKDQGAPEYVMFPREYLYLVTLDETHYAYFVIVPADVEGEKPADEEALADEIVKQFRIDWIASPADGQDE